MEKFEFKHTYEDDMTGTTELTYKTEAITLEKILQEFEAFLKGCGYSFDGEIIISEYPTLEECECQKNQE